MRQTQRSPEGPRRLHRIPRLSEPKRPGIPQPAPSRARTLDAGERWARLAQARAASRPGLCAIAPPSPRPLTETCCSRCPHPQFLPRLSVFVSFYSFVFPIRLRHISEELRPVTKCSESTREVSEPLSSGNAYPSHCTEYIGNLFLIFFSLIKSWND